MIRYWLALILIFSFGVSGRGEEIETESIARNVAVTALTIDAGDFFVVLKKDNEKRSILLLPCEDNIEVVIDGSLQDQGQIVADIRILFIDIENSKFPRRITLRVKDKTAADKLNKSFIEPFRKMKSCSAV